MKNRLLTFLAGVTLSSAAFAQQSDRDFNRTYGVLGDRNMFLRERPAPQPPRPNANRRPQPDSPEVISRAFVLRGVTIEDEELHAYLENARNGEVARVSPGDRLSGGRVVQIAIDAIAYEVDGRVTWIEVGQNLAGARSAAVPPAGATTLPSDGAPGFGAPMSPMPSTLPPGGGTLEERMKARRAQQRGQGR